MLHQRSQEEITQVKQEMECFYNGLSYKKNKLSEDIERSSAVEEPFHRGKSNILRRELARIDSLMEDASSWFCGIIPLLETDNQVLNKKNISDNSSDSDSTSEYDSDSDCEIKLKGTDLDEEYSSSEDSQ